MFRRQKRSRKYIFLVAFITSLFFLLNGLAWAAEGVHEGDHFFIVTFRVFTENIGDIHRKWAVDEDGHTRNFAVFDELKQVVNQRLRAPHGKGRDDHFPTARDGASYDVSKFVISPVRRIVRSIAVCAFHDQVVDVVR